MTFVAFPGPAEVTYGQQIAYKATFLNKSGTTLTHVIFRQGYPVVNGVEATPVPGQNTCPAAPVIVTKSNGSHVWTCDFGNRAANAPQVGLTVVWQVPPQETATTNCPNCLVSNGRWTVKEGVNDVADPNDAFPSSAGIDVPATLLASNSGGTEKLKAGGYVTQGTSCADPSVAGNLQTNPDVNNANPVSTTVCLPPFGKPANGVDLGYVTTITERVVGGKPDARHSQVCVAKLGTTCPDVDDPNGDADFGLLNPPQVITHVFHVADAALLPKGYKITAVSHNGGTPTAQGACDSNGFCVVTIRLDNFKGTKIWTIVVTSRTNGYFDW
ncbi:MAG TPA: hypothetical protein VF073_04140 [Gaiella sp.]